MSAAGGQGPQQMAPQSGPPYAPTTALLGGHPTVPLDDPICACLLLLFIAGAATHLTIFRINRKRDHKFVFSALLFGFCMARITTLVLRIVWASRPRNVDIAIAANIFVQAGVLLLFIINLIFAQRIVRSYHPRLGWSRGLGLAFKFLYFCVAACLIMVITATVDSFFTLDKNTRRIDRDIQLVAGTFLTLLAFLPIPVTLLAVVAPRAHRPEKFGQGRQRTKIWLLLFTSVILTLGAGFRIGVNFTTPRPANNPAWFHSKACFYCFNFVIELAVVYAYAIARFDRRYHVPDGSNGPGHYSGERVGDNRGLGRGGLTMSNLSINRESDVFGDETMINSPAEQSRRQSEWEAKAREELEKEAVSDSV
ncbi:hypothetical protein J7T55_012610 [Diaporthe amygdali]|uniref:uncharacterized protein n=1 Tax=Phomopsis amygdali TaxID=1214568 RepID=UPI0022FE1790|nr:uncharacterized protein J7T55_012610 [Diaporthe amygdali]KAJ0115333.1 hypothetical protein J7T55_012610 [Diaporthe amygdali]